MIDLVIEKDKRNEVMKKINDLEILDKVKEILTFESTDFMTIKLVADYYEVPIGTIKSLISEHREELESNGLKTLKVKEFKELLASWDIQPTNYRGYFECNGHKFSNKATTIISKRVLLNIGMLLRDSEVAKELRSRILDIVFDSEKEEGSVDTIVKEINEEKDLKISYVDAMMNGDIQRMNEINAKLFELKNRRINELEDTVKTLEPLAEKWNKFLDVNGLTDISSLAKDLGIKGLGRNNLYKYLRENGFLNKNNEPYQKYIDNGYFTLKPNGSYELNGEIIQSYKLYITAKGVDKIINILKKQYF